MSQGPIRSKDSAKNKNKEKFATFETMVGIERPQANFLRNLRYP
jgi:hypothetical protein